MKYFIYRLEITDGEHEYYSSGILQATDEGHAITKAGKSAKNWYEGEEVKDVAEPGKYPAYEFPYQSVICAVDIVQEIPKEDYKVLSNYPSFL